MRAGRLNRKVRIEKPVDVKQADGGSREAWETLAGPLWAAIEPLRGREYFDGGGPLNEVDHRIRLRYRSGINATMRVVYKERIFDIQSVIDIRSARRELHLMGKEYDDSASRS